VFRLSFRLAVRAPFAAMFSGVADIAFVFVLVTLVVGVVVFLVLVVCE
jgi:hypothetical protein